MADIPASGSIIRFPYLWRWQRDKGETEGRKARPVCMILAIPKDGETHLILLAISGTPPRSDQTALEIPQLECRRAGIRDWKEAWITVSEFNYDIAERSFYFDPNGEVLGAFSKGSGARSRPRLSLSSPSRKRGSAEPIELRAFPRLRYNAPLTALPPQMGEYGYRLGLAGKSAEGSMSPGSRGPQASAMRSATCWNRS